MAISRRCCNGNFNCWSLLAALLLPAHTFAQYSDYYLGAQGSSCATVCTGKGLYCNPFITTGNSVAPFVAVGVSSCLQNVPNWFGYDQPYALSSCYYDRASSLVWKACVCVWLLQGLLVCLFVCFCT